MIQSFLLTAALLTGVIDVEVQTLDGQKTGGHLTELGQQRITIESATGPVTFEVSKLMSVSSAGEQNADAARPQVVVELIDDTRLNAKSFSTSKGEAQIELVAGGNIKAPTKIIRYARFVETAPTQGQLAKQWDEILALEPEGDLLVTRKKGSLDYTEGLVRDIDADTVNFSLDGEDINVKRPRVEAVLYYRATAPTLPDAQCVVHLRGSGQISASRLGLDGDAISVTTTAGAMLELPVDSLARLDYSVGKIQYLSDLEAELTEVTPYVGGPKNLASYAAAFAPRRDRNFENEPLKLGGRSYDKGLALHSQTRQTYRLAGKFRQFTALAGIDDAVSVGGDVLLQVSGDGKPLWEGTIKGGEPPQALELDVAGVKRLELLVGFGDDLDIGDHLDLCDAKLMK